MHVKDIQYIRASRSCLMINTIGEQLSFPLNLSQFIRKNPIPSLIRVHRSFIVNIDHIDSFDHRFIYIGEHQIPLGDSYREKFLRGINCA